MDNAIEQLPHLLPFLVEVLGVSRYLFWTELQMPDHSEVAVVVGGADLNGEKSIGWLEVQRHAYGSGFLGAWTPMDESEFWLMRLLENSGQRVIH